MYALSLSIQRIALTFRNLYSGSGDANVNGQCWYQVKHISYFSREMERMEHEIQRQIQNSESTNL